VLILERTRGPENCAAITFTSLATNHSTSVDLNADGTVIFLVRSLQSSHKELLRLVNFRVRNNLFSELIIPTPVILL